MESDYENKNWDPRGDTNTSSSLRRRKLLEINFYNQQTRKYADKSFKLVRGREIVTEYKHLGGISRGYLDTGTVTNTMNYTTKQMKAYQ